MTKPIGIILQIMSRKGDFQFERKIFNDKEMFVANFFQRKRLLTFQQFSSSPTFKRCISPFSG